MSKKREEFNVTKWFRNKYILEAGLENNIDAERLSILILKAIDQVDENLSYKKLAQAVAIVLKDEYGSHNFKPFMDELNNNLNK